MRSFQVGDQVDGRYVLRREIARGGGGVVYEAVQRFTTRSVAIKLLLDEHQLHPRTGMRLLREARALTVARHRNVVSVLDAGTTKDGGPYLVMELLEGRALDGILAARRTLSPVDAAWVVAQVADGVAKLHRHGLVHRDIKPSNVFIKYTEEGDECATLLDFGAATHEAVPEEQRITKDNSIIGTPEYMSPEQLMGNTKPEPGMDIYSLGVLLYECLLGDVPHNGSYGEVLLKVHSGSPTAFHEEAQKLPEGLRKIMEDAMVVDSKNRLPTAAAMAEDLRKQLTVWGGEHGSLLGLAEDQGPQAVARRRYTRAPYVTPVRMILADGRSLEGKSQDLSTGGLLVLAPKDCKDLDVVGLVLALPPDGKSVEVEVKGRWSREARQDVVFGFEFKTLPEALSENIRAYVLGMVSRNAVHVERTKTL